MLAGVWTASYLAPNTSLVNQLRCTGVHLNDSSWKPTKKYITTPILIQTDWECLFPEQSLGPEATFES